MRSVFPIRQRLLGDVAFNRKRGLARWCIHLRNTFGIGRCRCCRRCIYLAKAKKKLNTDQLVVFGSLGTALAMFIFALIPNLGLAYMASFIAGFSWLTVLTNLNVSAQVSLPEWVRARGLAIFVTFFFGSMSLGSLIWGQLASITSIQTSLLTASICLCLVLPISHFFNLAKGQELNLAPSSHWPAPLVIDEIRPDRGPVMIFIEYQISAQNRDKFIQLMDMFKHQRYRDGAYSWGIFQDSNNDSKFIEYFLVSSWVEHLRQHERVTFEDQNYKLRYKHYIVVIRHPR